MFRYWGALYVVGLAGLFGSLVFPPKAAFDTQPAKFTSYEIATAEGWIKGALPVLAGNFEQVSVSNVGEDVPESIDFDGTLVRMYDIVADTSSPPLDLRGRGIPQLIGPYVKFRSEAICHIPDRKFCYLALAWDENSTGDLTAIMTGDYSFAIVADNLLIDLGVIK